MTTMADVARRAGVSVSTVSHVVNKTRAIRPDTEHRVLAAIADTGFVVNTRPGHVRGVELLLRRHGRRDRRRSPSRR